MKTVINLWINILPVVDQMQIHGIVGTDGIVGCDCICDFTMSLDGFITHGEFGRLTDQRNRAVDDGNQLWNNYILAA